MQVLELVPNIAAKELELPPGESWEGSSLAAAERDRDGPVMAYIIFET